MLFEQQKIWTSGQFFFTHFYTPADIIILNEETYMSVWDMGQFSSPWDNGSSVQNVIDIEIVLNLKIIDRDEKEKDKVSVGWCHVVNYLGLSGRVWTDLGRFSDAR